MLQPEQCCVGLESRQQADGAGAGLGVGSCCSASTVESHVVIMLRFLHSRPEVSAKKVGKDKAKEVIVGGLAAVLSVPLETRTFCAPTS